MPTPPAKLCNYYIRKLKRACGRPATHVCAHGTGYCTSHLRAAKRAGMNCPTTKIEETNT